MCRGFSLLELMLGIVLLAILAGMAVPRVQRPLDRLAVDRAVYDAVASHVRARSKAITDQRVTLLNIGPDSIRMRVLSGSDTAASWGRHGGSRYGVDVTGSTHWLRFLPSGVGYGVSNGSWTFSRGASRRRVIVSRLGRIRVVP